MVAISAAEEKSRNGVSGVSRPTIVPASPGFDALFILNDELEFRAVPVIAWAVTGEPEDDPLAISPEGANYNAVRYPDGRVYSALMEMFQNTNEWLKSLKK